MGIRDFFRKRVQDEVVGAKILVASLDPKFGELLKADSHSYSRFYSTPTVSVFESLQELLEALGRGYDVVHLFCDVSQDGIIRDGHGSKTTGTALIKNCADSGVKLLWIASENKSEGYIKDFKLAGSRLNLVMTMNRNGTGFSSFLDSLLSKMSKGETMPVAWASLAPQIPMPNDSHHQDLPACIFGAGRGGVRLR